MTKITGNALILQSGGPTRVINASLIGALDRASSHKNRITNFWGSLKGPEGMIKPERDGLVDLYAQNEGIRHFVSRTPGAALRSSRKKIGQDEGQIKEELILESLKRHEIRYFFVIGGNDSADNAYSVSKLAKQAGYELRVFHIPKTIDNDLRENDHTPGFGSAARYVACAFRGDDYDNKSLQGIKINIVMGRSAGFLTAASSLARQKPEDAPHLIYVPEVPFEENHFLSDLESVFHANNGRAIVAVSEGIVDNNGNPLGWNGKYDSHKNKEFSGKVLHDKLEKYAKDSGLTKRIRIDTFGYLQRAYLETFSNVDRKEARRVGEKAVDFALKGDVESGSVVILRNPGEEYSVRYELRPLEAVARTPREMSREFMNESGNNTTREFLQYAGPLIGARLQQTMDLDFSLKP